MTTKKRRPKDKMYGNRILELLAENEMTAVELSDLSGVTAPHISRIINGQRRCISLPVAIKIANVLGRPVEEVFIYIKPTDEDTE